MENERAWKARLETILASVGDHDPDHVMDELLRVGADIGTQTAERLLRDNPQLLEHVPALKQIHYEKFARNEIAQSTEFLRLNLDGSTHITSLANPSLARIYHRTAELLDGINLKQVQRVVLVGSGWVPATLYYFHDHTDIPELVGLDVDSAPIETSRVLSDRLGYNRIRLEQSDGAAYDFAGAQLVYVVAMVRNKKAVLSRIADTGPGEVIVLANEPFGLGYLWADPVESMLDARFEVVAYGPERTSMTRLLQIRRRS
jgi:hypothetical protein